MRFHTQTAGVSLDGAAAAQQRRQDRDRGALGGARRHPVAAHQQLRRGAWRCRPRRPSGSRLRTQQILAHETGVANTIDPLGGSYFVEALTDRMEEAAYGYFEKIDELGGMVQAIELNYPQREIAEASFRLQEEFERGERIIVGVNRYQQQDERELEILRIPPELERKQIGRVQAVKASRDSEAAETALTELREPRRERPQPDGPPARLRPRTLHRGRDRAVAAARLRHLHRDARLLRRSRPAPRRSRRRSARSSRTFFRAAAYR